ncbi:MAG: hypothetical protein AAGD11_07605 [Planctomycetota bacterium]
MDEDTRDLLHTAAGRPLVLQYQCSECEQEIYATNPVEAICKPCGRLFIEKHLI